MPKIVLRAYHFNGTNYASSSNCPLAEAIKEEYKTDEVAVAVSFCRIDGTKYVLGSPYGKYDFIIDNEFAKQKKYNSNPIREIELSIEGL